MPTAFTGIITGVVLGIARVAGETAPLLILVGYSRQHEHEPVQRVPGLAADVHQLPVHQLQHRPAAAATTWTPTATGSPASAANYAPDRLWGAALT